MSVILTDMRDTYTQVAQQYEARVQEMGDDYYRKLVSLHLPALRDLAALLDSHMPNDPEAAGLRTEWGATIARLEKTLE